MAFQRIGILSIGEMGYNWAKILTGRGVKVLTYAKDRSETTRQRAEKIGVECVPSLASLVKDADQIGKILQPSGVDFVDGCIIGSASKMDKGAVVYVSGPKAPMIQELEAYGFSVKVLGPAVAQASAFKVVYAGLTKGLQGLFVELLMGARAFGLLDEILKRYEESFPGLLDKVTSSIVGLRIHAGRRAEEMDELKRTFNHHGMKSFMAPAAQKVLQAIAALDISKPSDSGAREGELLETLELFYGKGLLQEHKPSSAPGPIHAAG
jgi:3-hydroxyisobutyrate dehydrogenase-like beta-hydroxyacid dehydrogenase